MAGDHLTLYQVDAFADQVFSGNPAAVIPLESWLPEVTLQKIATENNLSETAFFVKQDKGYAIRWFTPTSEVDLCGHATMASAYVIFQYLDPEESIILFDSKSGPLQVERTGDLITMDFPKDDPKPCKEMKAKLDQILRIESEIICKGRDDFLAIVSSQKEVEEISPNFQEMSQLDCRGVIVSGPGENHDFVSRCFYPTYGVNEDPVTGSAHCLIAAYWSEKMVKTFLEGRQLSPRGGNVACEVKGARVILSGTCHLYMKGTIRLP